MNQFWVVLIAVLLAPFLAYYVTKFAAMGFYMGRKAFRDFQKEEHDNGETRRP